MAANVQVPGGASVRVRGFDWDHANHDKCQAHGVSLDAIEAAFQRPIAVVPDPSHSVGETRLKAIGVTRDSRHILIVFTLRRRDRDTFIRPISARYMHRREIDHYEKAAP